VASDRARPRLSRGPWLQLRRARQLSRGERDARPPAHPRLLPPAPGLASAMNFAFSDEQQALRDQARKFLSDRAAPARVRRILESDEPFDRELWRGMGELAWTGTAIQ